MNILIVDDHQLFLEGLSLLLKSRLSNSHICCAQSAESALHTAKKSTFDLCISDLYMPHHNGMHVIQQLKTIQSSLPVLLVSSSESALEVSKALQYGAKGYLNKSASGDEILAAVHKVIQGGTYLPAYMQQAIDQLNNNRHLLRITKKQHETLSLMAKGFSNKQIAETMQIKEATVKTHVSDLLEIFCVKNRTECIISASELGIISLEHNELIS